MARPSKMTPTKLDQLRQLRAAGKSEGEISKLLKVSRATLASWESRDAAPVSEEPSGVSEASAAELLASPMPARDDPEALTKARERAVLIQRLLEKLTAGVEKEEYPATSFVTLARYGDECVRLIHELTPPAPKNPDEDPDVIDAERVLVMRVGRLISEAEKRQADLPKCPTCGGPKKEKRHESQER